MEHRTHLHGQTNTVHVDVEQRPKGKTGIRTLCDFKWMAHDMDQWPVSIRAATYAAAARVHDPHPHGGTSRLPIDESCNSPSPKFPNPNPGGSGLHIPADVKKAVWLRHWWYRRKQVADWVTAEMTDQHRILYKSSHVMLGRAEQQRRHLATHHVPSNVFKDKGSSTVYC